MYVYICVCVCIYTHTILLVNYTSINLEGKSGPSVLEYKMPYDFNFSPPETLFQFYGPQEKFKIEYLGEATFWAL